MVTTNTIVLLIITSTINFISSNLDFPDYALLPRMKRFTYDTSFPLGYIGVDWFKKNEEDPYKLFTSTAKPKSSLKPERKTSSKTKTTGRKKSTSGPKIIEFSSSSVPVSSNLNPSVPSSTTLSLTNVFQSTLDQLSSSVSSFSSPKNPLQISSYQLSSSLQSVLSASDSLRSSSNPLTSSSYALSLSPESLKSLSDLKSLSSNSLSSSPKPLKLSSDLLSSSTELLSSAPNPLKTSSKLLTSSPKPLTSSPAPLSTSSDQLNTAELDPFNSISTFEDSGTSSFTLSSNCGCSFFPEPLTSAPDPLKTSPKPLTSSPAPLSTSSDQLNTAELDPFNSISTFEDSGTPSFTLGSHCGCSLSPNSAPLSFAPVPSKTPPKPLTSSPAPLSTSSDEINTAELNPVNSISKLEDSDKSDITLGGNCGCSHCGCNV